MATQTKFELETLGERLEPPVMIVSTGVGRGMFTLGEALRERFPDPTAVEHFAVEDHLPGGAVGEDLRRYRWISNRMPFLLNIIYKTPIFYYRKHLREALFHWSDLSPLRDKLRSARPRTVICISHRPAFWVSHVKRRENLDFRLWGLLGEYGNTLAWKYLFWREIDGFLSPLDREELDYPFPEGMQFETIDLPAQRSYERLTDWPGSKGCVLVVCGFWGQGPILRLVERLLAADDSLRIHVVCGANDTAREQTRKAFQHRPNVRVHGAVGSLVDLMAEAGCVITKPGISTILEARSSGRKIFLVKGIPVSENGHNAGFARTHFGAEWFTVEGFRRWREAPGV